MRQRLFDKRIILLTLILIVASGLRLYEIDQPFTDLYSAPQSTAALIADGYASGYWNIFLPQVRASGPGQAYQGREFQAIPYLTALIWQMTGPNEWVGRLIAVIAGIWGLYAFFRLTEYIWDSERALASSAVMAILPVSVFVERSFLPDPVVVALMTTSIWLLLRYLDTKRERFYVVACLVGTLGVLLKIPALVVGVPLSYAVWARTYNANRHDWDMINRLAVGAGACLTIIVAYYLWAQYVGQTHPTRQFSSAGQWLWNDGLGSWWSQYWFLPQLGSTASNRLWTWPALALCGVGLFLVPKAKMPAATDKPAESSYRWLYHWWLLAGLIYYFVGANELVNNTWNLHIVTPAIAALAGLAVRAAALEISHRYGQIATTVVLVAAMTVGLGYALLKLEKMYAPPGGDSTEAYRLGQALRDASDEGDLVIGVSTALGEPVANYYSGRHGWVFPPANPDSDWRRFPEDARESVGLFDDLVTRGADWFGIVRSRHEELERDHARFLAYIDIRTDLFAETDDYVIRRIRPQPVLEAPSPDFMFPQKIVYRRRDASSVTLVWGLQGWSPLPEDDRPPGTILVDGVMHSPMAYEFGRWAIDLMIPFDTLFVFGFMVQDTISGQERWETREEGAYWYGQARTILEYDDPRDVAARDENLQRVLEAADEIRNDDDEDDGNDE